MAETGPRNPFTTLASVALFAVAALMIWRVPHPLDTTEGWMRVAAPITGSHNRRCRNAQGGRRKGPRVVQRKDTISPQLAAEILAQFGHIRGVQEQEGRQLAPIAARLEAQDVNEERLQR
jgi:hypothetical protein